jgi:protein gp37
VSIEPMLGPVDLKFFDGWDVRLPRPGAIRNYDGTAIEAVILGGETGPGARPMHPDWARGVRDQCRAATVPFFFKRWGEWGPTPEPYQVRIGGDDVLGLARVGRRRAGRVLDGRTHDELPWRAEVALK